MMTERYDADPAMERAGAEEDALDAYEQKVWDELCEQYESQHGEEVPSRLMDDHRDELWDWMNDDVHPRDAAKMILEGEQDDPNTL